MKKILFVVMAFVLSMAVTSCKQGQKAEGTDAAADDPLATMTAIVEKVKADGANMSIDEWKDVVRQAMTVMAPIIKDVQSITAEAVPQEGEEADAEKLAAAMGKLAELQKKFEHIEGLMGQLDSISKLYPNGLAAFEDSVFTQELQKELGIEEGF